MFGSGARTSVVTLGFAGGLACCVAVASGRAVAQSADVSSAPTMRIYGGFEYLRWWVKGAPLPVPLLSTGPDVEPIELSAYPPHATIPPHGGQPGGHIIPYF